MTTCRELSEMVGTIGEEFGFRSGGCSYVDRMAQPRVMWSRYKDPDGTERIDVRMSDYFDLHPDIIGLMVRLCMEKLKGRDSSETFRRLTEAVRDEAVADECRSVYMMRNGLRCYSEVDSAVRTERELKDLLLRVGDWKAGELDDVTFVWGDARASTHDGSWVMRTAVLPVAHAHDLKRLLEDADDSARKACRRLSRLNPLQEVE